MEVCLPFSETWVCICGLPEFYLGRITAKIYSRERKIHTFWSLLHPEGSAGSYPDWERSSRGEGGGGKKAQ